MGQYVGTRELAPCIRDALESVSYRRRDIEIRARESVSLIGGGCDGRKSFATMVDLETGHHSTMWGSWGGANMFNPRNHVDLDSAVRALPPGTVVIQGSIGGTTYASISAHPETIGRLLPAPAADLTDVERTALRIHHGIKAGEYRREELARAKVTADMIDSLVQRGYLSRNRAGAVQITTAGKNAAGEVA